jgi:hypothetical protein
LSAEEAQADCNGDADNDNAQDDEQKLLLSHKYYPSIDMLFRHPEDDH